MRIRITLMALPLLVAVASADAQGRVLIGGGPSTPVGAYAEEANTGFHLQGSFELGLPVIPVGVRGDLLWQRFPGAEGGNFTEFGGLVNATVGLPLPLVSVYAVAGVGMINRSAPDQVHGDHTHTGGSETTGALAIGAGARLIGFFVEARYLHAGRGHGSVPITVGLRF